MFYATQCAIVFIYDQLNFSIIIASSPDIVAYFNENFAKGPALPWNYKQIIMHMAQTWDTEKKINIVRYNTYTAVHSIQGEGLVGSNWFQINCICIQNPS